MRGESLRFFAVMFLLSSLTLLNFATRYSPLGHTPQTRAKLSHFSSLNKRFAAQLKRCSPDVFLKMGRIYHEVLPVERRMDAFVELLRKEELKETECGREMEG